MPESYTEENFNRILDLLKLQEERAEMWKGAFYAMEGYRDFWRDHYYALDEEYNSFVSVMGAKN